MKPNSSPENMRIRSYRQRGRRGFALVISLSLMVLLTVLAVGLLTLSTVSLRASGQSEAMQVARSNARMALSLAIGQLQKSAGPDQRITGPASLADQQAPRGLTGVWKGVRATAQQPVPDKEGNFVGYLVSGNEGEQVSTQLPNLNGGALMLGTGSLGEDAKADEFMYAKKVESPSGPGSVGGRYAWTVMDEGIKAKADLVREEEKFGNASHQAAMGAPSRFGMEGVEDFEAFDWFDGTDQRKLYTIPTSALIDKMPELKKFQHDVTTVHQGLATDAARGGLKKDLSLLFSKNTLPAAYSAKKIYDEESVLTDQPNPMWLQAFDYSNLYRNLTGNNPTLKANVPAGYNPVKRDPRAGLDKVNPVAPRGMLLMPIVAKVQMQFSMVAKDAHGPWAGGVDHNTATPIDNYMVYLIYSPIVTLYNPYNMPLSFDELRIEFKDLPIGFRFYKNGAPQTVAMAHMNQLFVNHDANTEVAKAFTINVRNNYGPRTGPVIMQPGENKVFGESVDGDWSWGPSNKEPPFFDYDDSKTANISLAPGYPSQGVGFWVDWLTPDEMKPVDDNWGVFPLRLSDQIDVGFGPMVASKSGNRLAIKLQLVKGSQNLHSGQLDLDYVDVNKLRTALSRDPSLTFPGGEARLQRPYRGDEMYESPTTQIKNFTRAKAFAQFNFFAKTTLESDAPARPWVQGGQASSLVGIDLARESMGVHPFETALKRLAPSYKFPCDGQNRGKFFTGHSELNGTRIAPQYEIPQLPVQSLAQLRHAGLCNQGFLPGAAYTVGESFATPMIAPGEIAAAGTKTYRLLDHAWLANTALWDSYFFSTISPHAGSLLSARPLNSVAEGFFKNNEKLLNPRFLPTGTETPEETVAKLTDDDGYLKSAAHLMIDGAFNVNSTSVNAWIALLSSMNKETIDYSHIADGSATAASGSEVDATFPFSRMRRAGGPSVDKASSLQARHARWTGMRTLERGQIEELAQHIVDQVKLRGPFLSLAEFVNRRPGNDREMAREGMLQKAIEETNINQSFADDSRNITTNDVALDNYAFPEAMTGMSATGAPGFLTQGDILSAVGSVVTVRSDTFRIRGYGEALDPENNVIARAWCEAVVQRTPDFVDPSNEAEFDVATVTEANKRFGRRFVVTGFRWISHEEV